LHSSLLSAANNAEPVLEWQVSPIPSNDQITIRLGNPPFVADFQLVNEFGAVVRSGRMVGGEYVMSIDRLPAGVYALRIVQGARSDVRRVVIAR
jgi:hypothetical protein